MQVSRKRVVTGPSTGLPTQGASYSSSSIVSEYGAQVAAKAASLSAVAASSGANLGLSSSIRRTYGTSGAKQSPLSMYNDAPQEEVTLDQFEKAGVDRLQAHKQLESTRLKKGALLNKHAVAQETDSPVSQILNKYNLDHAAWDNLSHFVLRLAYCKTEELRRWFITQESALFKYRFDTESEETITQFLRANEMHYEPLTADELAEEIPHEHIPEEEAALMGRIFLRDLLHHVPYADAHQSVYFKVPFEDAIDLLRERKVYLRRGFAYVSRANLSAIISTKFRANLSLQLSQTCRATASMRQDPRIVPLVSMLSKQYINPMYKATKIEGAVTKEQLPTLADRSMPLCMSNLYAALKAEDHLKHSGRMQFGLFLKGIGLSLNDALAFWKASFARRIPPEKFDKEYAYNIRHNYGKEGKRTTYTPYGCAKIINSEAKDHAGCPFKSFDEAGLRLKMRAKSFAPAAIDEILALVKTQHYQIACQRYYAASHGGQLADNVGNHPNTYFDESEKWWREKEMAEGKGGAPAPAPSANGGAYVALPGNATAGSASAPQTFRAAATPSAATTAAPAAAAAAAPAASGPAPMDTRPDSPVPSAV